jgi:hypothetical protein
MLSLASWSCPTALHLLSLAGTVALGSTRTAGYSCGALGGLGIMSEAPFLYFSRAFRGDNTTLRESCLGAA